MPELPMVGSEFAGYRIRSVIGRGGMSVVYQADNYRLGSVVALKVLAPELATNDLFRTRFLEESRIAASLNHPNVIPIYDMGPSDGLLYIAMRYVSGTDMRALLNKQPRPLPPEEAVFLLGQGARALDAAHRKGLVHRDVKPGNFLIENGGDDDPDHVYLSDFGITKYSMSRSGLTPTGEFLGTIDYIAPEQIRALPVDGRADQYSLGCILYECLTGHLPFEKERDAAIIWAHVEEMPPLPSTVRADLPAEVDDVFARVLAKNPEERYPTCRAFVDAARTSLALPVTAPRSVSRPHAVPPGAGAIPAAGSATISPQSAGFAAGAAGLASPDNAMTEHFFRGGPAVSPGAPGPAQRPAGPPGSPQQRPAPPPLPPALASPPRRPRRRRWPYFAAAAAVLVLLIGALGGYFLFGRSSPAKDAAAGSSGHRGQAMKSMHVKPSTLDKALLLTNKSSSATGDLPPSACHQQGTTTVMCMRPKPAIDEAVFRTYPSLMRLYSAYVARVKALSGGTFQANVSDCRHDQTQGEVSWNHMYQHPKKYSLAQSMSGKLKDAQAVGRVFCTFTGGLEYMVWTQNDGHLLGEVRGAPHQDVWLWWVPVHHNIALGGISMKNMKMPGSH